MAIDWTQVYQIALSFAATVVAASAVVWVFFSQARARTESELLKRQIINSESQWARSLRSDDTKDSDRILREIVYRLDRLDSFQDRQSSSIRAETVAIFEDSVRRTIQQLIGPVSSELTSAVLAAVPPPSVTSAANSKPLVREICHALLTPLSRIDAIAQVASTSASGETLGQIRKVRSAVQVCFVYLNAFRATSYDLAGADKKDFFESVCDVIDVYTSAQGRSRMVSITAPKVITGVEEYYLLACALPLVENAIEATSENKEITIIVSQSDKEATFSVTNPYSGSLDLNKIFEDGYSSKAAKEGNHEGLGLGISKGLAEAIKGGRVEAEKTAKAVTFSVVLPKRQ